MIGTFTSLVCDAYVRSKDLIWEAKEQIAESEMTSKLKYSGEKTVGMLKYTGNTITNIAQSESARSIVSKASEKVSNLFSSLWSSKPSVPVKQRPENESLNPKINLNKSSSEVAEVVSPSNKLDCNTMSANGKISTNS